MDFFQKNISFIGTKRGNVYIKNPKLPFNFNNSEGAYLISSIFFDGGIDRQYKPHYGNLDESMRKRIVQCFSRIIGELNSKETNFEKRVFVRFPKVFGIILNYCFGIGIGNKMDFNNKVPNFLFDLTLNEKSCFIRQAFDDDGSVSAKKNLIKIIGVKGVREFEFYSDTFQNFNLFIGLRRLLDDLSIEYNPIRQTRTFSKKQYGKKGKYFRHQYYFSITGRKNIERFHDLIGFNIEHKQNELQKLIKSYKQFQLRKGEINKITLEVCKTTKEKITIPYLSRCIKRTYRQTVRIVRKLEKDGYIKQIKPSLNIKGRRQPAVYTLIKYK